MAAAPACKGSIGRMAVIVFLALRLSRSGTIVSTTFIGNLLRRSPCHAVAGGEGVDGITGQLSNLREGIALDRLQQEDVPLFRRQLLQAFEEGLGDLLTQVPLFDAEVPAG